MKRRLYIASLLLLAAASFATVWQDDFNDMERLDALSGTVLSGAGHVELARALPSQPQAYVPNVSTVTEIGQVVNGTLYDVVFPQDEGTIELWLNADFSAQRLKNVVDKWSDSRNHIFYRAYNTNSNSPNSQLAFQKANDSYQFSSTFDLNDNEWNFVAITWDCPNQEAAIFLNGAAVKIGSISDPAWRPSEQEFTLGNGFSGSITNVRLLSTVLTPEEISDDYSRLYQTIGTVISEPVIPLLLDAWDSAEFAVSNAPGGSVKIQLEYEDGPGWNTVADIDLPGNGEGFTSTPIDLSMLDPVQYPALRLKATLATSDNSISPTLLNWQMNMDIAGHPRVYLRPSDIPAIQDKLTQPEFLDLWQWILDGTNRAPENHGPICSAFVYLMTGDEAVGRKAVADALPVLQGTTDARTFHMPMHWSACVYDWCYPVMTETQKMQYVAEFERIAGLHSPWYPAQPGCNAVVGHDTEGWLLTAQLPAGVAIYDESSLMFDAAADVFFNKFKEVRDFYYPGHAHHQGDSYGSGRFVYDLAASWLFRRLGYGDVLSREQRYVPYHLIYCTRPDWQQMRRGDTYDDGGKGGRKRLNYMLSGTYYNDPFLLTMTDGPHLSDLNPFDTVLMLIFREPSVPVSPLSDLPRTRFFDSPAGEMVARTGWSMGQESPDALVHMRIGEYFFGNHQRRDAGTFQIYYKGALAIASGLYEDYGSDHWKHYYHQTLSHNGLLIHDPAEPLPDSTRTSNSGGQLIPNEGEDHPKSLDTLLNDGYHIGSVSAHAFGPDPNAPEYSMISGDITDAYSDKVRKVTRSMVTLTHSDSTYPCSLVVYDRIVSSDPSFKKTWLLHSIEEPAINGSTITILRSEGGYGGKLVAESLLPSAAQFSKVGGPGYEFWVESMNTNFYVWKDRTGVEPGAWRVEISPGTAEETNTFLNVMTVMDTNVLSGPVVSLLDEGTVQGATVLDRAVIFAEQDAAVTNMSFSLSGTRMWKTLVADLATGYWSVRLNGQPLLQDAWVTAESGSLYFAGTNGLYELELQDPASTFTPRGVPAAWLLSFGITGDPAVEEEKDPDSDGMPTWQEYFAGTVPTNTGSCLKFNDILVEDGDMGLYWQGGTTATQVMESCEDLLMPVWSPFHTNFPPTTNTFLIDPYEGQRHQFYRIRIPSP